MQSDIMVMCMCENISDIFMIKQATVLYLAATRNVKMLKNNNKKMAAMFDDDVLIGRL
jgi:hypothetical protein